MPMGIARSIEELRALSDDDLIREHDEIAAHTQTGLNYYLEELARRQVASREQKMQKLTQVIVVLTSVNVVAVIVVVIDSL